MTTWLDNSVQDVELRESVKDLIKKYPDSTSIIKRLVDYYDKDNTEQAKRRKVNQGNLIKNPVLRLSDLSFQSPARKKYDLIITDSHLILYNTKSESIESQYSLENLALGVCVPTPEKTNKSFTFAIFPQVGNDEAIVFNTQDKVDISVKDEKRELDTDKQEIVRLLTIHTRISFVQPSKDVFNCKSTKEDQAYVVAYLKAKDGFLFFLPTGILFGFKKPTLFIPTSSLLDHAVTSITQRTFDLVLTIKKDSPVYGSRSVKEEETIELSMISQEEYAPIDSYIKQAGINDQSMSEERKAVCTKNEETTNKEQVDPQQLINEEDSEVDENFEPSDEDDSDPLEYDTDAEEDEVGNHVSPKEDEDMLEDSD